MIRSSKEYLYDLFEDSGTFISLISIDKYRNINPFQCF